MEWEAPSYKTSIIKTTAVNPAMYRQNRGGERSIVMKVMVVAGTRPEIIKLIPVVKRLREDSAFETVFCMTGQHREMAQTVLDVFGIRADVDLNLMSENQSLTGLSAAILTGMQPVLTDLKPDWLLVQGDTTTVMAAALAAFYNRVRVGHVEAGLRSYQKWAPYPEEINRRIAGVVADLHFAPTSGARDNLLAEGVDPNMVHVTGNTVIDALKLAAALPFELSRSPLAGIPFDQKEILTITAHRRENFGKPLENICAALRRLAEKYAARLHLVYPVHLNPQVRDVVSAELSGIRNTTLLDPLDYLSMVQLMKRSKLILTDSGGLQEEAPGLGVPVFVLRDVTERPEGVASGNVRMVGTETGTIVRETSRVLDDERERLKMAAAVNPYGDGHAAERIAALLKRP